MTELEDPTFGVVSVEDIHDLAGVPEGSEIWDYKWVNGGLKVEYYPPEDDE